MPAVFWEASRGSCSPFPVISNSVTFPELFRRNSTSSPGCCKAKPNTSNPHDTLATVADANALTHEVFMLAYVISNANNIGKYSGCGYFRTGTGSPDYHGPF